MLIYDCEIINAIPAPAGDVKTGINYCEGWGDFAGMGVSIIGTYDYIDQLPRVFFQDNFEAFQRLASQRRPLVGYNNDRFDFKLLQANSVAIHDDSYDVLKQIWKASGRRGGYRLEQVALANGCQVRMSDGANAPIAWQRGEIGWVVNHCLADIFALKHLVDLVLHGEPLVDPTTGSAELVLPLPVDERGLQWLKQTGRMPTNPRLRLRAS